MSYNKDDLIKYRMEKAYNSLEEARTLAEINHWDAVVNRIYYSCFYAITAYMAKQDLQAITHKGTKSVFHKELIKNELMSKELGKFYNDLFNKRQEADYKDFATFKEKDIEPLIGEAAQFIAGIKKLLESKN